MIKYYIFGVFCIILMVVILNLILSKFEINIENMVNITDLDRSAKWTRNKKCKYLMNKTLRNILKKYNIKETKNDDWTIYFPCTYNKINDEIKAATPTKKDQRLFIVKNADELTSKNAIWKNLVKKYGRIYAKLMMPATYILSNRNDIKLFNKEYRDNKFYILKKNIQRQKGLKITNNKKDILYGINQGYVIVQELLQDPYLIDKRKINMRFYLLLVCKNSEIISYVHREGFMYYTKVPFKKGSLERDPNITTGYIDRKVYEINPLTHGDLRKYLDRVDRDLLDVEMKLIKEKKILSEYVFNNIYRLLKDTVNCVKNNVCHNSHLKDYLTFQLFGVDIAINNKLKPQLMEINKGPDMSAKDKRDSDIKHKVMSDVFRVLKILPDTNHSFILLD